MDDRFKMDDKTKAEILDAAKSWMRDELAYAHKTNTTKLKNSNEFNINPFLWSYLAYYLEGDNKAESLAKVLIYPRVLGTSINTSFGSRFQDFITRVFSETFGSTTQGIDIEFIDKIDGRKKYCQIKAGPNVINHDDVTTIKSHFSAVKSLARTNHLDLNTTDLMFCLLYGEPWQKNAFIKSVEREYVVVVGKEFWHRFTGDENFYADIIDAVGSVAKEFNMKSTVNDVIKQLAADIAQKYPEIDK